jgi:hypothetical protein
VSAQWGSLPILEGGRGAYGCERGAVVGISDARRLATIDQRGDTMRSLRELLHREQPKETLCPRCGVPAPPGDTECTACGWDLREGYHDPLREAEGGPVARDRDT